MTDILIVICCILGGFALGKFIEKQICIKGKFYQDLNKYVALLKDNVNGRQLELAKFNEEFVKRSGTVFAEFLENGKLKLHLSKSQKNNVSAFFDNLDCASSQALIEHINFHSGLLSDDAKTVLENEVAKSSIYGKLGMLLGAMLGILLI